METNEINLWGTIKDETFKNGEHNLLVEVQRLSSACDLIPISLSEEFDDRIGIGKNVEITGRIETHDKYVLGQHKLITVVAGDGIAFNTHPIVNNEVRLIGNICVEPTHRETPLGREISDFLLAVRRTEKKIDYIPCIAWGRTAKFVSELGKGSKVEIYGRFQSRKYNKKLENGEIKEKINYEISISEVYGK